MPTRYRGRKNSTIVGGFTHRTAGLDQIGPTQSHVYEMPHWTPSCNPKSIRTRAALSTKRRKVKITLAERA